MEGYERDGVGEGYQVVVADDGTDAFYRHLLDAVCAEDDGEGLAQHVEEEGIHAEGEQHFRFLPSGSLRHLPSEPFRRLPSEPFRRLPFGSLRHLPFHSFRR